MRIIGIMLIAAAAVYGGVSYTALKREQLNELEALCHMLRLMQDELETRALPLPELAAQLDMRTENAGKALLSGLLRRLPVLGSQDFQSIWKESVTESVRYSGEAARLLCTLGSFLGRYDVDSQLEAIRSCREMLEKLRTTAAEALPQTRRLGMGLALTSGALIVITLI